MPDSKYLFFDVETTGLPKSWKASVYEVDNWPRIVQLAWVISDKEGAESKERECIIKPDGFRIPKASERVHGISTTQAMAEGEDLKTVLKEFMEDLNQCQFLVAHNISFDSKVLGAELIRMTEENPLEVVSQLCTMQLSTNYCKLPGKYGYKWPTLTELHVKLFGTDFEEAHDALVDVQACKRCFVELGRLGIL